MRLVLALAIVCGVVAAVAGLCSGQSAPAGKSGGASKPAGKPASAASAPAAAKGGKPAAAFKNGAWSQMLQFKSSAGDEINYYLFTPAAAADKSRKLPMVLWLHGGVGSNGVGAPNVVQDAFYKDQQQDKHPCYVLRPVAIKGQNWVSPRGAGTGTHKQPAEPSPSMKAAMELTDKLVKELGVDESRLYVAGASMGGYGTWDLIERCPGKFAAAIPLCGGADPSKAEAIKGVPICIYHGDKDPYVPVKASREMFDALMKACGEQPTVQEDAEKIVKTSKDGKLRYVEIKGAGHNPAWDKSLADEAVIEWMFSYTLGGSAASQPAK
jgi:predicted peptidase